MSFVIAAAALAAPHTAAAQASAAELEALRAELAAERAALDAQRRDLEAQERRLQVLEQRLLDRIRGRGPSGTGPQQVAQAAQPPTRPPAQAGQALEPAAEAAQAPATQIPSPQPGGDVQPVGEAPEPEQPTDVAVLPEIGGIITSAGRLTVEANLEYARSDRNRFVFRGIQVPQSVFVGAFDINESRQDVLTTAGVVRYGVTDRLEVNARVPGVYRNDESVVVPLVNPNSQVPPQASTVGADAFGIGDIEVAARYQLTGGTGGFPYLIAGVQAIAPTGTSPFDVPRNALNQATEAATGSGFWGVTPSITALVLTDPATLFGSLSYTFNVGEDINRFFSDDTFLERVDPGDSVAASMGIGIALNQRVSVSFAYAHSWSFATLTRQRNQLINPLTQERTLGDPFELKTRDLQIGRFLFGISYRASPRVTLSWNVELGATEDASDLRTTLRIPFVLLTGN